MIFQIYIGDTVIKQIQAPIYKTSTYWDPANMINIKTQTFILVLSSALKQCFLQLAISRNQSNDFIQKHTL